MLVGPQEVVDVILDLKVVSRAEFFNDELRFAAMLQNSLFERPLFLIGPAAPLNFLEITFLTASYLRSESLLCKILLLVLLRDLGLVLAN